MKRCTACKQTLINTSFLGLFEEYNCTNSSCVLAITFEGHFEPEYGEALKQQEREYERLKEEEKRSKFEFWGKYAQRKES